MSCLLLIINDSELLQAFELDVQDGNNLPVLGIVVTRPTNREHSDKKESNAQVDKNVADKSAHTNIFKHKS